MLDFEWPKNQWRKASIIYLFTPLLLTFQHRVIELMDEMCKEDPGNFTYGNDIVIHFKKVAHTAVRYTGTIAGNLMLKHAHQGSAGVYMCVFMKMFA